MNERIQQLAEQAGLNDAYMNFDHKYFAQLIVRECISTLEEKIYRSIDNEGDEIWIDDILKEHFGVEKSA